jgi:hypothetical protein
MQVADALPLKDGLAANFVIPDYQHRNANVGAHPLQSLGNPTRDLEPIHADLKDARRASTSEG